MRCANCRRTFQEPEGWDNKVLKLTEELSELLQEAGIPLSLSPNNPLGYIDGMSSCCDRPDIRWGTTQ